MDAQQANRVRILYIWKILMELSDDENPISTSEIISILADTYGISTHRTTIPKDIAALQYFGIDIVVIQSTQNKYFIGNRQFELAELKLLVDAVESSKFITQKKSNDLVSKLSNLTSKEQSKKLKRNLYIDKRIKPVNEQIYYIVDTISTAINDEKQIMFQYYEYNYIKKKVLRNNGEYYTLSPYSLAWNGDFYYVFGFSNKHEKVIKFRVDRIVGVPTILKSKVVAKPLDFNVVDFSKKVFAMYDGEFKMVELLCDNSLMNTIIDRFGEQVAANPVNDTTFRTVIEVSTSPTFFGWLFSFGKKISIIAPQEVKKQFEDMINDVK